MQGKQKSGNAAHIENDKQKRFISQGCQFGTFETKFKKFGPK